MGALNDRVAVIAGAGTGLGRAAAIAFASEGADVALFGRRPDSLKQTAAQVLEQVGKRTMVEQVDVTDEQQVGRAISNVVDRWKRIDVLLNTAAIVEAGTMLELTSEQWNKQISTNLTAPFLLMKAVLPNMRSNKYGRIIHITSSLSRNGAPGLAAYSAARAGLESLTRTVAAEEREHGILVNLYNPGMLRTERFSAGKEPAIVMPDIVRLASLSFGGPTGTIHSYG